MKIELIHSEIEKALIAYVDNQGIDISKKEIQVSMVAGRGSNGYTAHITLSEPTEGKEEEVEYTETTTNDVDPLFSKG